MDETPQVRHPWLWYGLATLPLIALVAIAMVWFAVKLEQARKQRAAVDAIRRMGGVVYYDYQVYFDKSQNAPPPGPEWLRKWLGVDFIATVEEVFLSDSSDDAGLEQLDEHFKALPRLETLGISGTNVTDAGLKHIAGLSQVKHLHISRTSITDSGLEHIQGLTKLEWLFLRETGITDAGLRHLAGLKHLTRLDLTKTKITGPGLRHLEGLEDLKLLYLGQTKITDAGLEYLKDCHQLKEL